MSICLQVLVSQEKDRRLKKILEHIQKDLHSGYTLSSSMAKFKTFSEVIVSIISSGEEDGRLEDAFERAAKILDNEVTVSSKLKSALAYPLFLLGLTIVVLIILNIVVLPIFVDMFGQMGADLPPLTRVVMGISNLLMRFWYLFVLVIIAIIAILKYGRTNSVGFRLQTDKWIMNLPLVGKVLDKLYISRFCRVMSSLTHAGVEIIYALNVTKKVIPNLYIRQYLDHVLDDVRVGITINQSMSKYPVFDSLLVSMVRVGEESGMLDDVLDKVGELYEVQTEEQTKLLTSLVEPIVTVLIALIVGTVVISVVLPMFGQYRLML
ncbi:MAG: type II secretion system F family protein [Clostridiales bacterium]|nr:type II secretion system F family protein [Clostridiales bacterium]